VCKIVIALLVLQRTVADRNVLGVDVGSTTAKALAVRDGHETRVRINQRYVRVRLCGFDSLKNAWQ
jgi:hypothetical protein